MSRETEQRDSVVLSMAQDGFTHDEIAAMAGVSRQRVGQILAPGKRMGRMDLPLSILNAAKGRWLTPGEMVGEVGMVNVAHVREAMYAMRDRGFLHMRNRSHDPDVNGDVPKGRIAREFRVRTEWGGLES